jgi:hypothetical protein
MNLKHKKEYLHNLVEEMANPRDALHESYKEKMKTILLLYAAHLIAVLAEKKGRLRESEVIELTDEFVEKSFNKAE